VSEGAPGLCVDGALACRCEKLGAPRVAIVRKWLVTLYPAHALVACFGPAEPELELVTF
jgi:hypothetical protein